MRRRMTAKILLFIGVTVAAATTWLALSRGSRLRLMMGLDREIPNAEFVQATALLGPHLTEANVESMLAKYPTLHYTRAGSDRVAGVWTPQQWDARDWVGWLEFRPDGHLLATRFGFVDYLLAKPEDHGLPRNACWGTDYECKATRVAKWGAGY